MNREEIKELAEHIYDLDAESISIWAPPWAACSTGTESGASMS